MTNMRDVSVTKSRRTSPNKSPRLQQVYQTNLKQKLMTGPQAASVYYGPAARNPLSKANRANKERINMQPPQLASEKFVFQKSTKMDSP